MKLKNQRHGSLKIDLPLTKKSGSNPSKIKDSANKSPKPSPAFTDEGERCFFTGCKKAVAIGRLNQIASQFAMEGGGIQEPG